MASAAELSTATVCRVIRLLNAANDAFLAGDPDSAVAWCEEALLTAATGSWPQTSS